MEVSLTTVHSSMIGGNPCQPTCVCIFCTNQPVFVHEAANVVRPREHPTTFRSRTAFSEHILPWADVQRQHATDRAAFHLGHVYVILLDDGRFQATLYSFEQTLYEHYDGIPELDNRLARYTKNFTSPRLLRELSLAQAPIILALVALLGHTLFHSRNTHLVQLILEYEVSAHLGSEPTQRILNTAATTITAMVKQNISARIDEHPFLAIRTTEIV